MKDNKSKYLALSRVLEGLVLDALGTEADEERSEICAGIAEMRRLQQESENQINNLGTALAPGKTGENYDIPELRSALMAAQMDRDNLTQRITALEAERELLPTDGIDVRARLVSLLDRVENNDPVVRSEVKSLIARLILLIDCGRVDWPEWENKEGGNIEEFLPEWAQKVLDQGFTMFSKSGPLGRLMVAIQMRNGRRIAAIRSKHTVLHIRPAEPGQPSNAEEWSDVVIRA